LSRAGLFGRRGFLFLRIPAGSAILRQHRRVLTAKPDRPPGEARRNGRLSGRDYLRKKRRCPDQPEKNAMEKQFSAFLISPSLQF
jgi:hypothetical protein